MELTIRTDKIEAEVGLYRNGQLLAQAVWQAHRQLAETLHQKIYDLLDAHQADWHSIKGVVCFAGPGSFTGLRIGTSVANAISTTLNIAIIGSAGDDWEKTGLHRLQRGENDEVVIPDYGSPAQVTSPRK